jgi:hypothetical protein
MNRRTRVAGFIGLCLIAVAGVTACDFVYHIETALPPELAFSDDRLPGTWKAEGDDGVWEILEGPGPDYLLQFETDDGERGTMMARLARLGPRTVLELGCNPELVAPEDCGDEPDDRRFLVVVEIGADTIATWLLNAKPLLGHFERSPGALEHRPGSQTGDLILTAPTPRLTAFLAGWLARPDALAPDAVVFRRQEPSPVTP